MPLTLTRKPGEVIIIGEDVFVTVVSISHGQARIRVEAPPGIEIDREEIRKLKREREAEFGDSHE